MLSCSKAMTEGSRTEVLVHQEGLEPPRLAAPEPNPVRLPIPPLVRGGRRYSRASRNARGGARSRKSWSARSHAFRRSVAGGTAGGFRVRRARARAKPEGEGNEASRGATSGRAAAGQEPPGAEPSYESLRLNSRRLGRSLRAWRPSGATTLRSSPSWARCSGTYRRS